MPFFDRNWQLRRVGAGLVAVTAVLLPLRYLQVAAVWDHQRGWDMLPDIVFAISAVIVLLGIAILLWWSAGRARARMEWRMEQLTAGIHPVRHTASRHRVAAPTAPGEDITIVQRVGIGDRLLGWMFVPIFIVTVLVTPVVLAVGVQVLANPAVSSGSGYTGRAFASLLGVPFFAVGLWLFGTFASDAWATSPHFELDQFGITQRRRRGRSMTIHWPEARLLEAVTYFQPEGRSIKRRVSYLLYGDDRVMRIKLRHSYASRRGERQLLESIEQHTGLVPRALFQPGLRKRTWRSFRLPLIRYDNNRQKN
jgi:hypothetical protein